MSQIAIIGRSPSLSLAELESIFGPSKLKIAGNQAVLLSLDAKEIIHNKIGGTQKVGSVLETLSFSDWSRVRKHLNSQVINYTKALPGSKVKLGISVYDFNVKPAEINATSLNLKKVLKSKGFSCRIIANKYAELNSAQVIHGGLLTDSGTELLIVRDGANTIIAKTNSVQDIDAYAARDHGRPMRDAKIGMLPPKLAQIIINLAIGQSDTKSVDNPTLLLDPFCGTGVVLQEALIMGLDCFGSDLEPRMVEYTNKNIEWLRSKNILDDPTVSFNSKVADATSANWQPKPSLVACETYLGRPLSSQPSAEVLNKIIQDCNTIHKKFLQNIARQTEKGFRMCVAVPAWYTKNGFKHLPILDSLDDLGYNRISFVHAHDSGLIYHRKDQIVARELVVLIKK